MNSTICYKCKYKCKCCSWANAKEEIQERVCEYCDIEHPMFKLDTNFIRQCPQIKHIDKYHRCDKCESHQQKLNFIYCPTISGIVRPDFYCAHYKEKENG